MGTEADINLSGSSSSTSYSYSNQSEYYSYYSQGEYSASIDWYSSIRLRIGLSPNPDILVYATAGFAFGQVAISAVSFSVSQPPYAYYPGENASSDTIHAGWIAGAGAEYALGPTWSVRAEALYMSLGTASINLPYGTKASGDIEMGVVRGGVNYQF